MSLAIEINALSKKYELHHQSGSRYATLRETLSSAGQGQLKRFFEIFNTKATAETVEEFWALKDVELQIKAGERVGIIGYNGAGKSTLLKILSRITPPTSGRIKIKGRVASLLEVGTGFHPELTGRENIYLNGAILGMSRLDIKRNFDEIVSFAEVEKFLDTPVKRYSSGMYVRLAFSVAAHLEPEILIVDEVLAVGDAAFQKKCLGRMEQVGKEGRTVLFVSHNMSTISLLCDRAVLLTQGRITASGETDVVISQYLSSRPTDQDLSLRTDRSGTGVARITSISFRDRQGHRLDAIRLGVPVEIVVKAKLGPEAVGKLLSINLVVIDQYETRLFSLQNEVIGKDLIAVSEYAEFVCELPEGMPLVPGNYGITFSLLVTRDTADKVNSAISFEVVASDFHQSGRLPISSMGAVLVKNQWYCEA